VNWAFGIAGSLAAGSTQYLASGSWNKRLHPGFAARNGLFAVKLASAGAVGSVEAFEGVHGVLKEFTDTPRPDRLTAGLGERWDLLDMWMKPYPAHRATHGAIDAALQLRDRLGPGLPAGARLTVTLNPADNSMVGGDAASMIEPRTTVEAERSVRFQVAVTLLTGVPDLSAYGLLGDPAVTELSGRITVATDPARPSCGAVLTVHREGGEEVTVRVDKPRGQPATAVSWEFLERKFTSLAGSTFTEAGTAAIIAAARLLADGGSAGQLAAALSPSLPR
jgi:2-methylcitrate dehydratase PrpD